MRAKYHSAVFDSRKITVVLDPSEITAILAYVGSYAKIHALWSLFEAQYNYISIRLVHLVVIGLHLECSLRSVISHSPSSLEKQETANESGMELRYGTVAIRNRTPGFYTVESQPELEDAGAEHRLRSIPEKVRAIE